MPENKDLGEVGLTKHAGILGEREGYPDFLHRSGKRLELKLAYVDPLDVKMKQPPTRREPSARLTQKVTVKNVNPELDALLVVAYQLRALQSDPALYAPTIIDLGVFSMIECIRARDARLLATGGRWFGNFDTPAVMSNAGKRKIACGEALETTIYGRKEEEGYDFNEDTNFGKLKRIPYQPLQEFLRDVGVSYCSKGSYPKPWKLGPAGISSLFPDLSS
jgi:hypothetical protein